MRPSNRTAVQLPARLTRTAVTTIALALVVTAMSFLLSPPAHADGHGFGYDDGVDAYDGDLGWFSGEYNIGGGTGCTPGSPGCFLLETPSYDWMESFIDGPTWTSEGAGVTIIYDTDGNAVHACSGMTCTPIVGGDGAGDGATGPPAGSTSGCVDVYDTDGNYVETIGPGPYSTTAGPQWWNDSGVWWGTKTYNYNLCGVYVSTTNNIICTLQACINETFQDIINQVNTVVENNTPDLQFNPTDTGVVQTDTWLWDGAAWDVETFSNTHPSAPVSAFIAVEPFGTAIELGDGNQLQCLGPGTPWSPGATTDCMHEYRAPSLGTGNGGSDVYEVESARVNTISCMATTGGAGGGFSYPFPCFAQQRSPFVPSPYPVQEVQSVNR